MPERPHFDPIGRIVSAACMLLLAALALNLAVSLVRAVWVWLIAFTAIAGALLVLVRLAVWWHRRRLW